MLVHEVMTQDAATVTPGASIKTALAVLADQRLTALPVVDDTGAVIGVVSEADLIRELVTRDPPRDRTSSVERVMSTHPVTVRPDVDLVEAVDLLTSTTVKSLPVVDRAGRLVGVLSRSDVVRLLARADHEIECEVDELLRSTGLEGWLVEVQDGFVQLLGPEQSSDSMLVRLLAETVPGVIDVTTRTESPA